MARLPRLGRQYIGSASFMTGAGLVLLGCGGEAPLTSEFAPYAPAGQGASRVEEEAVLPSPALEGEVNACRAADLWERPTKFEAPVLVGLDRDSQVHAVTVVDRRWIAWRSEAGVLEPRLARRVPRTDGRLRFEALEGKSTWALTLSSADEATRIEWSRAGADGRWTAEELVPADEAVAKALTIAPLRVPPRVVVHQRDESSEVLVMSPYPTAGAREFRAFSGAGARLVELPRQAFAPDGSGGGRVEFAGDLVLTRTGAQGDWQLEGDVGATPKRRLASELGLAGAAFACLAPAERRFHVMPSRDGAEWL